MYLFKTSLVRLFSVAEKPNAKGVRDLESFKCDTYNKEFMLEDIEDNLIELLEHLLDGGRYFEVTNYEIDKHGDVSVTTGSGARVTLIDRRKKINTDPNKSSFYVFLFPRFFGVLLGRRPND